MRHCVSNKIFWVLCLWLLCFDFWADIAYGKDELKLHKIQHYSHSRFLSLCTRFFSFLESANLLWFFLSSILKGTSLSQKHITQKSKGKSHNIKLKSQNTEVTSYEHRIQNICTRNTMSHIEARARVGRPQTSSSPPVSFIAGRPKAALLFWFFGDFRCGARCYL